MSDSNEIDDEELLYRKVSVNSGWFDPTRKDLKPDAFSPRKDDTEGISFDRARSHKHPSFRSIQEAAQGPSSNGYYVAVFEVADLREHGVTVIPDPIPGNPGHALIANLTYGARKSERSREMMVMLAHQLVLKVEGPFSVNHG